MITNGRKRFLIISVFLNVSIILFSQKPDSTIVTGHFGGAVTITNNGISTIPNLTLGKPAALFDLSLGRGKISFEPQFRFGLDGKPWTFILWWRYKPVRTENFQLVLGAHPAFAFKTTSISNGNELSEIISVQRFLAGEVAPTLAVSKKISIGIYYLYSYCLETGGLKNTNYVAGRIILSDIELSENMRLRFIPQVYYLKMDKNSGFYLNSSLSLSRRNFPLSLASTVNKTIRTEIPFGEDFLWNVSLVYTFNKEYLRK
jgi:hypothetical protein